jgi:hypothetical protein
METPTMKTGTITFPNRSCLALWTCEILGQMSDGLWENSKPHDHWQFWSDLEPRIADDCKVVTDEAWKCRKTGYNLTSLLEYVGDRMLAVGRMACITDDQSIWRHAEAIDRMSLAEFYAAKKAGSLGEIPDDIYTRYNATHYTIKDLKKDLARIKSVMKTVSR